MKKNAAIEFKALFIATAMMLSILKLNAQVQIGADIDGEEAYDGSGYSVSMPDANTLAIGAPSNDGSGLNSGHVRVFTWNGIAWVQKGVDIDGEATGDSLGYSVSMPDANTLAIGAPRNDGNGLNSGHVRVFTWNGIAWVQKGVDIDGEAAGYQSGYSISMPDANNIAIGTVIKNGLNAGHVRVYNWNGSAWVQNGADIDGIYSPVNYNVNIGYSVSMPDANTLAIGAPQHGSAPGFSPGHVRVFTWSGTAWEQKGYDILGEFGDVYSGNSVSMPDANTVAIGACYNSNGGNVPRAGHVRVFTWSGMAWLQNGIDIDGKEAEELSGYSVSMPDANTVAFGAPSNSVSRGSVRVYSLATASNVSENSLAELFRLYPNPASSILNVELGSEYFNTVYLIYDKAGSIVKLGKINSEVNSIELSNLSTGYYTIIVGDAIRQTFKVNRE